MSGSAPARPADDELTTLDFDVEGMTCAACAARVERILGRQDDVAHAAVNFATGRAEVVARRPDVEQLREAVARIGYGLSEHVDASDQRRGEVDTWRRRLLVAGPLGLVVLLLAMTPVGDLLSMGVRSWTVAALATIVQFGPGRHFLVHAVRLARQRAANMDTLVAMGTMAAWSWSVVLLLQGTHEHYFESAALIIAFLSLGRWLEARAKLRAGEALHALATLGASHARVVRDGEEHEVPVAEVGVGDLVRLRPGDKVPVDGEVVDGRSSLDESLLTGESMPVAKSTGDTVVAGSVNTSGALTFRATAVGRETALAGIVALVERAQSGKAQLQRLADRISAVFVPTVIVLALLTLLGWTVLGGDAGAGFEAAVAVLVIACPCALGLATPVAILVGTGRGADLGILIRSVESIEAVREVTTVVFDKTGTITQGRLTVIDGHVLVGVAGPTSEEISRLVAAAESASEHPIAAALVDHLGGGGLPRPDSFDAVAGRGVVARVEGREVVVGSPRLLGERGIDLGALSDRVHAAQEAGTTAIAAAVDGQAVAVFSLGDAVRPDAIDTVRQLRQRGLDVVLLTGDNEATARAVARQVGIERVWAEVLPAEKQDVVAELRASGEVVAMVGDGVNDAPALVEADLGIAMGSGTDVARESSDLTLLRGDVHGVVDALALSTRIHRTIVENLAWAFGYNVLAIPVAAAGLLSPAVAGGAMAFSSVSVVANALRLRRFRSSTD